MAKQFKKKDPNKNDLIRKEKLIKTGKMILGIGATAVGVVVSILTNGKFNGPKKS